MSPPPRRVWIPAALLALVPWGVLTWRLQWVVDDAWISFRYARNLARGHGLVYNLDGTQPAEGYSDLLWVLVAAAVEAARLDVAVVMPALSALCGALLIAWVARTAAALGQGLPGTLVAALVCGLSPTFAAWSTGGLETMPTALAAFVLAERLLLAEGLVGPILAAVALSLLRTEGPAWALVIAGLALAVRAAAGRSTRPPLAVAGVVIAVIAAHTGFRLAWHGDWIANTARAKVGFSADRVWRGGLYVVGSTANLPALALPLLGVFALRRGGAVAAALLALVLAVPAYAIVVGGDYMAFGRMLLLGVPFGALLLGWMARSWLVAVVLIGALGVGAVPAFDVELAPRSVRKALQWRGSFPHLDTEYGMWRFMGENESSWRRQGRMLKAATAPEWKIVTGAIGARGYFSNRTILDRGGLVVREPNLLPPSKRAASVSPGHDRTVEREFFLPWKPEVMDFEIADPAQPIDVLAKQARSLEPRGLEGYGPRAVLVQIDDQVRLVLLHQRASSPEEATRWRRNAETLIVEALGKKPGPTTW